MSLPRAFAPTCFRVLAVLAAVVFWPQIAAAQNRYALVHIENNTKDGKGIYREPVVDSNQTLDDADVSWAKVGHLILLRIKPFREEKYRYLVYDTRARRATRVDAIGLACHELPEDHGIVFPGGYYLQSGDFKLFDGDIDDLEFELDYLRRARATSHADELAGAGPRVSATEDSVYLRSA